MVAGCRRKTKRPVNRDLRRFGGCDPRRAWSERISEAAGRRLALQCARAERPKGSIHVPLCRRSSKGVACRGRSAFRDGRSNGARLPGKTSKNPQNHCPRPAIRPVSKNAVRRLSGCGARRHRSPTVVARFSSPCKALSKKRPEISRRN